MVYPVDKINYFINSTLSDHSLLTSTRPLNAIYANTTSGANEMNLSLNTQMPNLTPTLPEVQKLQRSH